MLAALVPGNIVLCLLDIIYLWEISRLTFIYLFICSIKDFFSMTGQHMCVVIVVSWWLHGISSSPS